MLDKKLKEYVREDYYPFHMPGHKRQALDAASPYEIDITEIDGFDNLHEAREILLKAQQRAANLYGSKECFYLVNGSTCGILAAISACISRQGKILVARNSHKAVYNGIFLRELNAEYVYPVVTKYGLQGQIQVEDIKNALMAHPDIEAVLITSPTYDGVVSDMKGIAEVVHAKNIPLIVDAAHGAHLGFSKEFPENPIHQGADVVIESVHKTLPAFTQTALLHICSNRVSSAKIKKYLSIYETSSPSYVLMAGIDRCVAYLENNGQKAFEELDKNLRYFYKNVKSLKKLYVLQKEDLSKEAAFDYDCTKIIIFSNTKNLSGTDLHKLLLDKYHIQVEMVSGQYVLALASIMDTREGFARLMHALEEIDAELSGETTEVSKDTETHSKPEIGTHSVIKLYEKRKQLLSISEVENHKTEIIPLKEAVGKAAAEYLYLYPPGIPVIVPGEEITKELIEEIEQCQRIGLCVEGLHEKNGICIVNFS